MAVKRITGRHTKKYRTCLRCGQPIDRALKDDEVYTCGSCGQQHYVDIFSDSIVLTAAEYAEFRRRTVTMLTHEQRQARRRLIAKAKARDLETEAWIDTYQDWLEELAQMPEKERAVELNIMSDEMRRRVLLYFDRRNKG